MWIHGFSDDKRPWHLTYYIFQLHLDTILLTEISDILL